MHHVAAASSRDEMEVTQTELAAVFGVHPRTIQRWHVKGLEAARTGPGQTYDVALAVAWRAEEERRTGYAAGLRAAESGTTAVAARKDEAIARRRELEVGVMSGELIDIEAAEQRFAQELAGIRSMILAFPGRLAPQLDRYKVEEALAIIEDAVHDLMTRLAEGDTEDDDG